MTGTARILRDGGQALGGGCRAIHSSASTPRDLADRTETREHAAFGRRHRV